jgi:hypothetical protein
MHLKSDLILGLIDRQLKQCETQPSSTERYTWMHAQLWEKNYQTVKAWLLMQMSCGQTVCPHLCRNSLADSALRFHCHERAPAKYTSNAVACRQLFLKHGSTAHVHPEQLHNACMCTHECMHLAHHNLTSNPDHTHTRTHASVTRMQICANKELAKNSLWTRKKALYRRSYLLVGGLQRGNRSLLHCGTRAGARPWASRLLPADAGWGEDVKHPSLGAMHIGRAVLPLNIAQAALRGPPRGACGNDTCQLLQLASVGYIQALS